MLAKTEKLLRNGSTLLRHDVDMDKQGEISHSTTWSHVLVESCARCLEWSIAQPQHWNDCALKHANSRSNIGPNGFAKYKKVIPGAELLFLATIVEEVNVGLLT